MVPTLPTNFSRHMTQPHSETVIDRKKRINEALNALKKKDFHIVYSAARHFKVSHATLDRHWAGSKSMPEAHES